MSADNRICIMFCEQAYDNKWAVWHGSGSVNYYEAPDDAKWFASKEEACNFAHEWHDSIEYVEYGINWIGEEEQTAGLREHINHLQHRLSNLLEKGKQFPYFDE